MFGGDQQIILTGNQFQVEFNTAVFTFNFMDSPVYDHQDLPDTFWYTMDLELMSGSPLNQMSVITGDVWCRPSLGVS